jgi:imidazoleglycerol-phosphate dehydratase
MRIVRTHRKTNETEIEIELNLDGRGQAEIETGIGFLDHMLHHVAVHGMFDLTVRVKGDLYIDTHHTIEDCAIVLGKSFSSALEDRTAITRMGSFFVPMDESLAFVAIDFSGRPFWKINIGWTSPDVADIPVTLFDHFFQSFAAAANCNLHVLTHYGSDNHHLAEASFKAFARALDLATRIDERRAGAIPSTKGTLTDEGSSQS